MKPKYVHTQVKGLARRNPGEDPDLGRVGRMPGRSKRLERRRRVRGEGLHRYDRRRIRQIHARRFAIKLWLGLMFFCCMCAFVAGIFLWLRSQSDRKNIALRDAPPVSFPALAITSFPTPNQEEIIDIIRGAMDARDADTLGKFVHHSDEANAEEMLHFFAGMMERGGDWFRHDWIGATDTEDVQIETMVIAFRRGDRISHRMAMLTPDELGNWRLDFPTFARWCDPPIQLMDGASDYPGGLVRVFVARDYYFNGAFSDDEKWACFVIDSPDIEARAFVYCRVDSKEQMEIDAIIKRFSRQARVTLEIERVDGAEPRQFRVSRVVRDGWLGVGGGRGASDH